MEHSVRKGMGCEVNRKRTTRKKNPENEYVYTFNAMYNTIIYYEPHHPQRAMYLEMVLLHFVLSAGTLASSLEKIFW